MYKLRAHFKWALNLLTLYYFKKLNINHVDHQFFWQESHFKKDFD
ncbi:hypothetical protein ACINWC487_2395 [Acinetobacter nosocomialis]|nr:hypothetical protein ACINWC487_2395 [Acinetobacter nosocomialis]